MLDKYFKRPHTKAPINSRNSINYPDHDNRISIGSKNTTAVISSNEKLTGMPKI